MRWLNDKNSVGNPVFGDQPRNSIHQLQLHKWDCNPIHQVLPKTWVIRVVVIDLHDLSTSTVASSDPNWWGAASLKLSSSLTRGSSPLWKLEVIFSLQRWDIFGNYFQINWTAVLTAVNTSLCDNNHPCLSHSIIEARGIKLSRTNVWFLSISLSVDFLTLLTFIFM